MPRIKPQFPIYIPTKGRSDTRLTIKTLEAQGVPYNAVVEEQEHDDYAKVINPSLGRILVLDKSYQEQYDTFDDLGSTRTKGSGPARNFIWDHSTSEGHERHWTVDDNIKGFYRYNRNRLILCNSGAFWSAMEDFCLRYENVSMAGPNYFMFIPRKQGGHPPFVTNTRIYSCNLIRNDLPYRWRGRYNEDTDLSLRMMKDGLCTIQFNAFLQYKMPTQTVKGGNTESLYVDPHQGRKKKGEKYAVGGTLAKSKMMVRMHPDVSRLVWKFSRWHHEVDYTRFKKNRLRRKTDLPAYSGTDNYGMKIRKREGGT